jgi:hypothetical protein
MADVFLTQEFVKNGVGDGPLTQGLGRHNNQLGFYRPYWGEDGHRYVDVYNSADKTTEAVRVKDIQDDGRIQLPNVVNATTLRKEQWIEYDRAALRAARFRLQAWGDLAASNTYSMNGFSRSVLEWETVSDALSAQQDMGVLGDNRNDNVQVQLQGIPLPVTSAGFFLDARKLAMSRNGDLPLDTTLSEMAGRRIAELVEGQTIGTRTGMAYGGTGPYSGGLVYGRAAQVYGYTNFPQRLTKTNVTTPTGANPNATITDVLAMINTLRLQKFYGPFMLYMTNDWDPYLDNDYAFTNGSNWAANPNRTLRERLKAIPKIVDVKSLDLFFATQLSPAIGPGVDVDVVLKPFSMVLVQMTPDVARAVDGMGMTTIQWEEKGGMKLEFRVMCIWIPQLRSDYYGNVGIMHGTTS